MMFKNKSLAILLYCCIGLYSCADDQARQEIASTNQHLTQLQQNVSVLDTKVSNQKLLELLNRTEDMQNQINALNGTISDITHEHNIVVHDLQQQLAAVESRLSVSSTDDNSTQSSTVRANTDTSSLATDKMQLDGAIKKIKNKQAPAAIKDLKQLIAKEQSDNKNSSAAQYYLSVAYLANSQYKEAINQAKVVLAQQSLTPQLASDSLRVIFIAQSQLGNTVAAKATAKKLLKLYPNTTAAHKVSQQI
jgi:TolA-binding protein